MAEKLHTIPVVGVWANMFGLGKIRDDHGNSISYHNLDCASGEKFTIPEAVHDNFIDVVGGIMARDFKIDGQLMLDEGEPSPLQSYCAAPGKLERRR